jgi:hypothetical protein
MSVEKLGGIVLAVLLIGLLLIYLSLPIWIVVLSVCFALALGAWLLFSTRFR